MKLILFPKNLHHDFHNFVSLKDERIKDDQEFLSPSPSLPQFSRSLFVTISCWYLSGKLQNKCMILVYDKCFILCTEEFAFLSSQESKLQSCVMCSQQNLHRNKINVHSIFMFKWNNLQFQEALRHLHLMRPTLNSCVQRLKYLTNALHNQCRCSVKKCRTYMLKWWRSMKIVKNCKSDTIWLS
jgi:hypothetical protein